MRPPDSSISLAKTRYNISMRISWLEPAVIRQAKHALLDHCTDWAEHFTPHFQAPPAPSGMLPDTWPHIAEHVARAEHVTAVLQANGFDQALEMFASSEHAIEQATLIAAANHIDIIRLDLIEQLLRCRIDDLVVYGNFLHLLTEWGASNLPHALTIYEQFCSAIRKTKSDHPMWTDRVGAALDGLASFYVTCGDYKQAHELFTQRHDEQTNDLVVSLCASRTFLSQNITGRAIQWLDLAATRAQTLGKSSTETKLRAKIAKLRQRLS